MELEFTITNTSSVGPSGISVSAINFTDDLNAILTGAAAVGLPATNICGTGSQISGTSSLSFIGGSLGPDESCTFSVSVQVPAGAATGTFTNTTSDITGTANGNTETVAGSAATDDLVVSSLIFTKEFTDDPVLPGGTVTLEFTIENTSATTAYRQPSQ